VVGHCDVLYEFCNGGNEARMLDSAVDADSFTDTLCDNSIGCGVEKLILQRAGAGVYYEYVHNESSEIYDVFKFLYSKILLYIIFAGIARGF
jgi:hypothetical protein